MAKYDLIVVLGSQPDAKTWKFPVQIYECLDRAAKLLEDDQSAYIATCGKWSIALDAIGVVPPFRECDALADYLTSHGVSEDKIIKEGNSKDTISNLYYLKIDYLIPRNFKKLLFVVAEFRIPRIQFLCEKILGSDYQVAFEPIACEVGSTYNEPHSQRIQEEFLKPMGVGDHVWLSGKFYSASVYQYWTKYDKAQFEIASHSKHAHIT